MLSNPSRLKYLSPFLPTKGLKVLAVLPDPLAHLAPLEQPDLKVQLALLDHKVFLAHRVLLAPLDLPVPQAL